MQELRCCNHCGVYKELDKFHKNKSCKFGRTGTCKVCIANKRSKWYSDNRRRRQEAANKRNQERKKEVVDHFGNKCHDCEQTFPQYVYEFHHLNPSKKDVNPSAAMTWTKERMWKELNKCIMVCANCHKIRHWGEREDRDEAAD